MLILALVLQAPLPTPADTPRPAHDALHYAISVTLPDSGRSISAEVRTRWRLLSGDPIRVELDSALRVRQVLIGGRAARGWTQGDDLVLVPNPGRAGDTVETVIRYGGVPRDGLVIRDSAGRFTAFSDNWPNRAHRWFPSQDHPGDKATASFAVTAREGIEVIANGRLDGIDRRGAHRVWRYSIAEPIPVYTMVIGAADFARAELKPACAVRCVPVAVWTYPEDSAWAAAGPFRRASEIVDYFSTLVGEFPYEDLTHVQSSTIFGGMENSTAIFYAEDAYRRHRLGEGTVAHETAHQWFGDAVTEAEWSHLWLSEGFATYFAGLWQEHVGGDSALRAYMSGQARGIFRSSATERPILDQQPDLMALLNSNNYNKGAWVLHSLRGLLGDSVFFAGIREYYRRFRNRTALSDDFKRVMEEVSGQDLDWYFRQALTQPGYPKLAVRVTWDSAAHRVILRVRQTQKMAWGTYRLPGFELLIDDLLVRVDLDDRESEFTFDQFAEPVKAVEVDPNGWWLAEVEVVKG
ncbi:MAG: M1 family aminopeptidase [Gemmatimonadales bacterium]